MKRNKKECDLCGAFISLSNFSKHLSSCKGPKIRKSSEEIKQIRIESARKAREAYMSNPECLEKMKASLREAHKRGAYDESNRRKRGRPGHKHSPESKEKISIKARASRHRRIKKNTSTYMGVLMDSSWEVKLAEWLDGQSIAWERPNPLPYGEGRNYFPDFYLPEFDIYLDPKNDYLVKVDSDKVHQASKENNVEILILSKQDLIYLGVM